MEDTFEKRLKKGSIGEDIVARHLSKMLDLTGCTISRINTTNANVEGADFEVSYLVVADHPVARKWKLAPMRKWKGKRRPAKTGARIRRGDDCLRQKVYPVGVVAGSIEVKTYSLKSFLKDNSYDDVKSGSIRIPIRQNSGEPSWFERIARCDEDDIKRVGKSKRSLAIVYIIQDWQKPLFAIAFTDVSAFLNRIHKMLYPIGIRNMRTCAYSELDKVLQDRRIYRDGNLMLVPFSELTDIATVTWINGNSADTISRREPGTLYRERLDHLSACAGDRRFYENDEPDKRPDHALIRLLCAEGPRIAEMTKRIKREKGIVLGGKAIDDVYAENGPKQE